MDWWLRSPSIGYNYITTFVDPAGWVRTRHVDWDSGVRPAFNVNLPSVLFVSAGAGGKTIADENGGVYSIPSGNKTEWKLTIKDAGRSGFTSGAASLTGAAGSTISIPYTGAQTGGNEYVSLLVCDSAGEAQYYGSRKISAAGGTAVFSLPGGLANGDYTVKLFNEQRNGSHESDYASDFVTIPLMVGRPSVPQTGDSAPLALWIVMLLLAMAGISASFISGMRAKERQ